MAKTTVTLKNGKTIQVMPREVEALRKAGLLRGTETAKEKTAREKAEAAEAKEAAKEAAEALLKEEKANTETKEFKANADTETKEEKPKQRPVNISAANVKIAKK